MVLILFVFKKLKWFNTSVRIFRADFFSMDDFPEEAATADFSLGLFESRLAVLHHSPRPAYIIYHGLSNYYVENANARLLSLTVIATERSGKLKAGYIGNLMMGVLDRATIRKVIEQHPAINFIFWGQLERKGQLVALEKSDVFDFIDFLKEKAFVFAWPGITSCS